MELLQERFEAWLFDQPKDRVIETADSTGCFLCSFLKETCNVSFAFISWDDWVTNRIGSVTKPIPIWAKKLIDREWCVANWRRDLDRPLVAITVAQMQQRYIELFGEPGQKEEVVEPAMEEMCKP